MRALSLLLLVLPGCGPIGLFAVGICKAAGASRIIASDVNETRLALARRMGAHDAVHPQEAEAAVRAASDGLGVDVVLEMSGSAAGIHTAFKMVRPGGDVALLGIPPTEVGINLAEEIIFKAVTVRGINGRLMFQTWYQCERFLLDHKLDLRPLITHQVGYKDYLEAFDLLEKGQAVKIVMSWE